MKPRCVLLGAGGHARVLIDCLRLRGPLDGYALLDSAPERWGASMMGLPILGDDEILRKTTGNFIVSLGSTGPVDARRVLFETAVRAGWRPETVIHPSAIIATDVEIGPGCQILAGAIVNTGVKLGSNVILNTGSIVEHDCVIEDHAHIATGARLAGAVHVGTGAHIGAGATVRQKQHIGAGAMVGAGAVVVRDVAAHSTVIGVPAAPR